MAVHNDTIVGVADLELMDVVSVNRDELRRALRERNQMLGYLIKTGDIVRQLDGEFYWEVDGTRLGDVP